MADVMSNALRDPAGQGASYRYYSLSAAARDPALAGLAQLPFSLRVLVENLLRHAGATDVEPGMLSALARGERGFEVPFRPAPMTEYFLPFVEFGDTICSNRMKPKNGYIDFPTGRGLGVVWTRMR